MRKAAGLLLVCMAFGVGPSAAVAQNQASDEMNAPPKVLAITQEYLKPGRTNTEHIKAERAFIDALKTAHSKSSYLALISMSGPSRALFLSGYPSFDAWEKDTAATQKDAALSQSLDEGMKGDGEVIGAYNYSVFTFRKDLSFRQAESVPTMRYVEISRYAVRPGHGHQFEEAVKVYTGNWAKVDPKGHFDVFQAMYGNAGNIYLVFHFMKTLSEVDSGFDNDKKFADTVGEEKLRSLSDAIAASTESAQTNLFAFEPKMSYMPESWNKQDAAYWGAP